MAQEQFRISGMTCINCQNKIRHGLNSLPGVQRAVVSCRSGVAQITYDSGKISPRRMEQEIERLGYEVLSAEQTEGPDLVRAISLLSIIIAGAVMVVMGLNMLDIFPWLRRMQSMADLCQG